MIFLISVMFTLGLNVYPAESSQLFTPEPGCQFKDHNKDFYKVVSQGRTVLWKKKVEPNPHGYTNLALNDMLGNAEPFFEEGRKKIRSSQTSRAVEACEKQIIYGGKHRLSLPTKGDYLALQTCFNRDPADPRQLSQKGLKDLYDTFTDMRNRWFWSSTASENAFTPYFAYYFSGYDGRVGFAGYRDLGYSVRCVVVKPSQRQKMFLRPQDI